ncbi:MFS family permease [Mycetocola sp. BIGb0189]|uniref:MFS transporter n=1 Tax=Mycetocola sp. BIGb0189 TaxID=2940604 RepID=UPI0021677529|nr:MFS transporter [Mycetocola sp. BIGb0189]MCS4276019.1 MFS family permease [Mycetocola sp. BIGb0189]
MVKNLFVDLRPLRDAPAFARIWTGNTLQGLGAQAAIIAVTFVVFERTGSSLAVGLIGLCVAIPLIALAPIGGLLADRADRRRLARLTASAQTVVAVGFVVQALVPEVWLGVLYILVAVQSAIGALAVPVRRTLLRTIVPPALLPAAIILTLLSGNLGMILGPALGGLLLSVGMAWACFGLQLVGSVAVLIAAILLPVIPGSPKPGATGFGGLAEGAVFVMRHRVLRGVFLADLSLTLLALPVALLPALTAERFGGDPVIFGLLSASPAVGAALLGLGSGALGRIRSRGPALLLTTALFGLLMVCVALSGHWWITLILLGLGGILDAVSVSLAQIIVQEETPDDLRGRVGALEHMVGMGGPQLGAARAGAFGSWWGASIGIAAGGVCAIVAAAALGAHRGGLRGYRAAESTDGDEPR